MLENSRKRSRKTKLELREGVEIEESSFLYMQIQKELQEKEINESDVELNGTAADSMMDVESKNNSETDPFQDKTQTPTTIQEPLMEFSVKVEVEECDVNDMDGSNAESTPPEEEKVTGSEVTTGVDIDGEGDGEEKCDVDNINKNDTESTLPEEKNSNAEVTARFVKVDATSNVFVATSLAIKPKILTVETSPKNSKDATPEDTKKVTEFKEYYTNRQMILRMADRLLKSRNIADTILAIEARNYAGRLAEEVKEVLFKTVLEEWNNWYQEHSAVRDSPLLYKCYICGNSYWHLYQFREHVRTHKTLKSVEQYKLTIESKYDECYIVYFMHDLFKKEIQFPAGDCYKCGKPASTHTFAGKNIKNHKCDMCKLTFSTCTQLNMHEMKCAVLKESNKMLIQEGQDIKHCNVCESGFYTDSTLLKHLTESHSVRSDIVMPWEALECLACKQQVILSPLHICAKKQNNYGCNYCGRSFQKKIYKELHIRNCYTSAQCKICDRKLTAACMEPSHLLQHTDNYALMYKCLECSKGRYFSDEYSIIHHTEAVHYRKFEKKFKYLEMVILPKQCLDRVSKQPPPVPGFIPVIIPRQVIPMKITSEPVGNKLRRLAPKPPNPTEVPMQVIVKEEPKEVIVPAKKICVRPEDEVPKAEGNPGIQIANVVSLNELVTPEPKPVDEDSSEDVEIIEREDDVISLDSDESYKETAYPPRNSPTSCQKRPMPSKVFCVCGIETRVERLKIHKEKCIVVKARRMRNEIQSSDNVKAEEKSIEESDPPPVHDDDSDYDDDDEETDDQDWQENPEQKVRQRITYICKCKFKGVRLEFKKHRVSCPEVEFSLRRPKKGLAVTCTKCNTTFQNVRYYGKHFFKSHGYKKNTCPSCMRQFKCLSRLATDIMGHVKKHFVKKRIINEHLEWIKCVVCKTCKMQEPVDPKDYFSHWEAHLQLKDFSKEEPESEKELVIDEQKDSLFKPSLMKKILNSIQSTDISRENRFLARRCVVCSRDFNRINDCKRHLVEHLLADALSKKRHTGWLRCQICSQNLPKADKYKHHMRKHASLPLFQCELCSKSFSDSSNFCKHKKVHNLAIDQCNICDKKFQNRATLAKHREMHENTKPLICDICSRIFYTQSAYNKHYRSIHDKRSSFPCVICKEPFKCLKDNWDHMWMVHEERKVKADCPLCDHSFRRFADVKQHVRMQHYRNVQRNSDGTVSLVCEANDPSKCKCCPAKIFKRQPCLGMRTERKRKAAPQVEPVECETVHFDPDSEEIKIEPDSEMRVDCDGDLIVFKVEEDFEVGSVA